MGRASKERRGRAARRVERKGAAMVAELIEVQSWDEHSGFVCDPYGSEYLIWLNPNMPY